MSYVSVVLICFVSGLMATGCACLRGEAGGGEVVPVEVAGTISPELAVGYARLHEVLSKNSRVDSILIIKSPGRATVSLLSEIANTSREASEMIEAIAEREVGLDLDAVAYPEIEQVTRDAIESATGSELLKSGGATFERRILITQLEAMRYAHHLAAAIAERETVTERQKQLNDLADRLAALRESAFARLTQINE